MKKWMAARGVLLCLTAAQADSSVWVEEEWRHISQELDCDGLPLLIDARVLQLPEGMTVQEYHVERLSDAFMLEKGNQTDWSLLGCDTSNGSWRYPTSEWPEYHFNGPDVYPHCSIGALGTMDLQNIDPDYILYLSGTYSDTIDLSPINRLTEEQVKAYAESVAAACGNQLGNAVRMFRCDQAEDIRGCIDTLRKKGTAQYAPDPAKAEEYLFFDIYYPVYFQGLRLYSGEYTSTVSGIEIPNLNMRMAVTAEHGIAMVASVLFDPAAFQPLGGAQSALGAEQAVRCIQDKYANLFLPGVRQITIHQMVLEYVAMTGDVGASQGYTLYPAWVVRYTREMEHGEPFSFYEAYHAVTGQPLF